MEEKTYVDDIDRSIYDIRNEERDSYRIEEGLSPAIVDRSQRKKRTLYGWNCSAFSPCRSITT